MASLAASPVLVGAVTTLVTIVAVFLAYNANRGLPFVPTYDLRAELPNAANLVVGNEVRVGGARIGTVDSIVPVRRPDGSTRAVISMKLERAVEELPDDSTLMVRPRSALGLKYVEVNTGRSPRGFEAGDTIPVSNARPDPVEVDEVLSTFDQRTRIASRRNLVAFGDALTGRGDDLNAAIAAFRPLLSRLQPVASNLADPRTGLARFFRELGDAAGEAAPVAEQQAALFRNLATTFTALAGVADPFIQETISRSPPTLDRAIADFPRQRPFLRNVTALARELQPGAAALPSTAPALADALEAGRVTLREAPDLNARLASAFRALERFATDPNVPRGIRRLAATFASLRPTLRFLTPAQTVCNYGTLFFRNAASHLSEGDDRGTWQRFIIISVPGGRNSEGGPSRAPGNGPAVENHLHSNPYPNTAAPGQPRECEAGNEDYVVGRTLIGNQAGNQGAVTDGQLGRRSEGAASGGGGR